MRGKSCKEQKAIELVRRVKQKRIESDALFFANDRHVFVASKPR